MGVRADRASPYPHFSRSPLLQIEGNTDNITWQNPSTARETDSDREPLQFR